MRLTLYQAVAKLLRAYANLANEMTQAGYTSEQAQSIKKDVVHFEKVRDEVKLASGDLLDMKRFEPAMRQLLDTYIRADESEVLMDFEELGLIELIVNKGEDGLDQLPKSLRNNEGAMAEAIENNVRKTIVDENPINPKYYEQMSVLLEEIIEQRRQQAISYQEYLEKIKALAAKVVNPSGSKSNYPDSINTTAKQSLYDNLGKDEELAVNVDEAVMTTKKADWVGDRFKEREVANAVRQEIQGRLVDGEEIDIFDLMNLIKAQREYQ